MAISTEMASVYWLIQFTSMPPLDSTLLSYVWPMSFDCAEYSFGPLLMVYGHTLLHTCMTKSIG
ncbi:hypothetical protein BLOT_015175 [Blomia tropicalis]|nr:hypothetical protein BLOT_015175 [Blomia tropicalis]